MNNELTTKNDNTKLSLKPSDSLDLSLLDDEARKEIIKAHALGNITLANEAQKTAMDIRELEKKLEIHTEGAFEAGKKGLATKHSDSVGNSKFTIENSVHSNQKNTFILLIITVVGLVVIIKAFN